MTWLGDFLQFFKACGNFFEKGSETLIFVVTTSLVFLSNILGDFLLNPFGHPAYVADSA